jgi:2-keto-4-pentenoate hydratase/2-oxohepta-3-ene-1,7-dioic acid hydratase in catechol pathway
VDKRQTFGVLRDNVIVEASDGFRQRYPDLKAVLEAGALAELETDSGGARHALDAVEYLPTIPNPGKVLCVGINYRPHVEEMGREMPERPMIFVRFPGSLTGHDQPVLRPKVSEKFDYEGELGVIIGCRARHVSKDAVADVIAGYCCFMDGSVRDWQNYTSQFTPGKNFHQSGSIGPFMVTRDEVPEPMSLKLETLVNGEVRQSGLLSDLIFDIPTLINYISTFTELLPGDVISTGTPGGVGAARKPPIWLKDGDHVAVAISGVGRLENVVRDE